MTLLDNRRKKTARESMDALVNYARYFLHHPGNKTAQSISERPELPEQMESLTSFSLELLPLTLSGYFL